VLTYTWVAAAAVIGAVTWILDSWRPSHTLTIGQGHAACTSGLGSFAQALSAQAASSSLVARRRGRWCCQLVQCRR
jgi:hypothetical protein